jgi:phage baseplate assembly protein W
MSAIAFPFRLDRTGRTARATPDAHVREMIEQVLFTSPGERVNRPLFGSGLVGLVFAPAGPEVVAAAQMQTQGALQHALDEVVQIRAVAVDTKDNVLTIAISYLVRETGTEGVARFTAERPG